MGEIPGMLAAQPSGESGNRNKVGFAKGLNISKIHTVWARAAS